MEKCAFDWIHRNFILITCLGLVVFTKEESQQYSYECNENGDITLLGLLQNSQVTIKEVVYKNGSSDLPNCTFTADQYGHVIINRSCTNDITELRPRVVVVGILEGKSVSSPTVSSSQSSVSIPTTTTTSTKATLPSTSSSTITTTSTIGTTKSTIGTTTSMTTTQSTATTPTTTTIPTTNPKPTTPTTPTTTTATPTTPIKTRTTPTTTTLPTTTAKPTISTTTSPTKPKAYTSTTRTTPTATTTKAHQPITSHKPTSTSPTTPTTNAKTTPTSTTKSTSPTTQITNTTTTSQLITKPSPITIQPTTPTPPSSPPTSTSKPTTSTSKPTTSSKPTSTKTTKTQPKPSLSSPPPPPPPPPSTTTTSTTTTSSSIQFRKKRPFKNTKQTFMLTCQQYKNGVIHNILGQLINRDTISLNPVFNSVGRVEMQFKSYRAETEDGLKYLPDISTVYLGDMFFMFLKYTGQQDYKIVPQSCSAYNGGVAVTNSVKPNVPLWSYDRCVSDIARKYHLMHGFEKINDKIIFAELFGFHFVDDADITMECDVMVCNKADNSSMCTLKQNDCGRTKFNRRTKRTTNKYVKVVKKLKIMNRRQQYTENTAMKHRQNSLMVLIGAVVYGVEYLLA